MGETPDSAESGILDLSRTARILTISFLRAGPHAPTGRGQQFL